MIKGGRFSAGNSIREKFLYFDSFELILLKNDSLLLKSNIFFFNAFTFLKMFLYVLFCFVFNILIILRKQKSDLLFANYVSFYFCVAGISSNRWIRCVQKF